MVPWFAALRFLAIKNTITVFMIVPLSKGLVKVCRPYPQWMPFCRRITTDYHKVQDIILNKFLKYNNSPFIKRLSNKKITDEYAENFTSKMVAWTAISFGVGTAMSLWHLRHEKKKHEKQEQFKKKQDYILKAH